MNAQLWTFFLVFLFPAFFLFFYRYSSIPAPKKEEDVSSREFWMFVGALLLFISAMFIIGQTSLPVINKFFGTKFAPGKDIEYSYNKVLILFGLVITILTAIVQYLKYKKTESSFLNKRIIVPSVAAIVISFLIGYYGEINYMKYGLGFLIAIYASLFGAVYAVIANAFYLISVLKGKMRAAGASIAHVGFGLMLLGILISSSKKEVLSWNTTGIMVDFGQESKENPAENLTLVKGVATDMGKYMVTYQGDSTASLDPKQYFKIHFEDKNKKERFTLYPDAFVNYKGNGQLIANPDSKHYLHKDVFTYITSLPDPEKNKDTSKFEKRTMKPGEKLFYSNGFILLESLGRDHKREGVDVHAGDSVFVANIKVVSKDSSRYMAQPLLILRGNTPIPVVDTVLSQGLEFAFTGAGEAGIELGVKESKRVLEYVTLKAYQFPGINLLWLGVILMTFGFLLSMYNQIRRRLKKV
jgi:cytochrome c-type biogenesis protein CcmF